MKILNIVKDNENTVVRIQFSNPQWFVFRKFIEMLNGIEEEKIDVIEQIEKIIKPQDPVFFHNLMTYNNKNYILRLNQSKGCDECSVCHDCPSDKICYEYFNCEHYDFRWEDIDDTEINETLDEEKHKIGNVFLIDMMGNLMVMVGIMDSQLFVYSIRESERFRNQVIRNIDSIKIAKPEDIKRIEHGVSMLCLED